MSVGRPSDYTPDVAAHICGQLVEGRSLRSICKAEDMPGVATVFKWLASHPEFVDQYARARDAQADTLADELIDIADDSANDYYDKSVGDGATQRVVDAEHINRSRLRVDTRKWIASKLKPKKYGEKLSTELTGADGGPIVVKATPLDDQL
jgi:hypothetical protein